jgi:hypothetical protein
MKNPISYEELLYRISQTMGKPKVIELTGIMMHRNFQLNDLLAITLYPEKQVAFRAAWIMENLFLTDPVRFIDVIDTIIANFLSVTNQSCQRHYAKILIHLTGKKADKTIKTKLQQTDCEPVAERCFDFLIDPASPIAVKVFSMEILFNLRLRYNWIPAILAEQIRILVTIGSAGIRSRGLRLLKQMV